MCRTVELQAPPVVRRVAGLAALLCALLTPALVAAQEAGTPAPPSISVVYGLTAGDLLNVRAAASPFGQTIGRLHSGSGVARFGCEEVKGYEWCKVSALDDPTLAGWAPSRYLREPKADEVTDRWKTAAAASREPAVPAADAAVPEPEPMRHAVVATAEEAIAQAIPDTTEPLPPAMPGDVTDDETHAEIPVPTPAPRGEPVLADNSGEPVPQRPAEVAFASGAAVEPAAPAGPAPDLSARLGVDDAGLAEAPATVAETTEIAASDTSVANAYSMAFAARQAPLTGSIYSPGPTAADAAPAADAPSTAATAAPVAEAQPASVGVPAPGVPVPSPRPGLPGESATMIASAEYDTSQTGAVMPASGGPAWIAAVEQPRPVPAARDYDAVADIPCARYLGQPMTACKASVARTGGDAAEVAVEWPDGGVRTISFRDGKPEKSDSRGDLRFTREAGLNMIRIGQSERFEITDALAFGG